MQRSQLPSMREGEFQGTRNVTCPETRRKIGRQSPETRRTRDEADEAEPDLGSTEVVVTAEEPTDTLEST